MQEKTFCWNTTLSRLLSEPDYYNKISALLFQELYLQPTAVECRTSVFNIDWMPFKLRQLFIKEPELLVNSILQICNKHLRYGKAGIAFRYWNNDHQIVILIWNDLDTSVRLLEQLNSAFYQTLGIRMHMGLGGIKAFPQGLPYSYSEAMFALKQLNVINPTKWIHTSYALFVLQTTLVDLNSYLEPLGLSLRSRNKVKWNQTIELWFHSMRQLNYIQWDQIKSWELKFNLARLNWLHDILPEDTHAYIQILEKTTFTINLDDNGSLSIAIWETSCNRSR